MLNETRIRTVKPIDKEYKLTDAYGLYLLVKSTGAKYWRYKYSFDKKQKVLAIGVYPEVTLMQAREAALNARKQLKLGLDPSAEKKAAKIQKVADGLSFTSLMEQWIDFKTHDDWSPKHEKKMRKILAAEVSPKIGKRGIKSLIVQDFLSIYETLEARGAYDTNHRVARMCADIMQYGVIKSLLPYNVAHGLWGILKRPANQDMPMLDDNNFPLFVRSLRQSTTLSERTRIGLWMILYTLPRGTEVRWAEKTEIDLDALTWSIPADKMKMRRPHRTSLPTQMKPMLERLYALSGDSNYLFPVSTRKKNPKEPVMSSNLLREGFYELGFKGLGTIHGLRSNGNTLLNRFKRQQGFHEDWIEMQLAHVDKNNMRLIYNREDYPDERREMMQWWADYLDTL